MDHLGDPQLDCSFFDQDVDPSSSPNLPRTPGPAGPSSSASPFYKYSSEVYSSSPLILRRVPSSSSSTSIGSARYDEEKTLSEASGSEDETQDDEDDRMNSDSSCSSTEQVFLGPRTDKERRYISKLNQSLHPGTGTTLEFHHELDGLAGASKSIPSPSHSHSHSHSTTIPLSGRKTSNSSSRYQQTSQLPPRRLVKRDSREFNRRRTLVFSKKDENINAVDLPEVLQTPDGKMKMASSSRRRTRGWQGGFYEKGKEDEIGDENEEDKQYRVDRNLIVEKANTDNQTEVNNVTVQSSSIPVVSPSIPRHSLRTPSSPLSSSALTSRQLSSRTSSISNMASPSLSVDDADVMSMHDVVSKRLSLEIADQDEDEYRGSSASEKYYLEEEEESKSESKDVEVGEVMLSSSSPSVPDSDSDSDSDAHAQSDAHDLGLEEFHVDAPHNAADEEEKCSHVHIVGEHEMHAEIQIETNEKTAEENVHDVFTSSEETYEDDFESVRLRPANFVERATANELGPDVKVESEEEGEVEIEQSQEHVTIEQHTTQEVSSRSDSGAQNFELSSLLKAPQDVTMGERGDNLITQDDDLDVEKEGEQVSKSWGSSNLHDSEDVSALSMPESNDDGDNVGAERCSIVNEMDNIRKEDAGEAEEVEETHDQQTEVADQAERLEEHVTVDAEAELVQVVLDCTPASKPTTSGESDLIRTSTEPPVATESEEHPQSPMERSVKESEPSCSEPTGGQASNPSTPISQPQAAVFTPLADVSCSSFDPDSPLPVPRGRRSSQILASTPVRSLRSENFTGSGSPRNLPLSPVGPLFTISPDEIEAVSTPIVIKSPIKATTPGRLNALQASTFDNRLHTPLKQVLPRYTPSSALQSSQLGKSWNPLASVKKQQETEVKTAARRLDISTQLSLAAASSLSRSQLGATPTRTSRPMSMPRPKMTAPAEAIVTPTPRHLEVEPVQPLSFPSSSMPHSLADPQQKPQGAEQRVVQWTSAAKPDSGSASPVKQAVKRAVSPAKPKSSLRPTASLSSLDTAPGQLTAREIMTAKRTGIPTRRPGNVANTVSSSLPCSTSSGASNTSPPRRSTQPNSATVRTANALSGPAPRSGSAASANIAKLQMRLKASQKGQAKSAIPTSAPPTIGVRKAASAPATSIQARSNSPIEMPPSATVFATSVPPSRMVRQTPSTSNVIEVKPGPALSPKENFTTTIATDRTTTGPIVETTAPQQECTNLESAPPPASAPKATVSERPRRAIVSTRSEPAATAPRQYVRRSAAISQRVPSTQSSRVWMTDAELKNITAFHHQRNKVNFCQIIRNVEKIEGPRPPSPNKVPRIGDREAGESKLSREERAKRRENRRSGGEGSSDSDEDDRDAFSPKSPLKHIRGPGDDEDYVTPRKSGGGRKSQKPSDGHRVRWDKGLVVRSDGARAHERAAEVPALKGCLKHTVSDTPTDSVLLIAPNSMSF